MRSISHMCRNAHYKVYLLNRMLNEKLCENIKNEKNNKEQHVL